MGDTNKMVRNKRRVWIAVVRQLEYTTAAILALSWLALPLPAPQSALAATNQAKISFTFDDGYQSAFTQAAPILAKYHYTATDYIDTANMAQADRMSWEQIRLLGTLYGWELAAHSDTHPYMSQLTPRQDDAELTRSHDKLAKIGVQTADFATPFGDYSMNTLGQVARYYQSHRGFWDKNNNIWPYNDYLLNVEQVQYGTSVADVTSRIDDAIANNEWLILVFHDIQPKPIPDPEYHEYAVRDLTTIVDYVAHKQLPVVRVSEGLATSSANLLPNADFKKGLANGWTTTTPASVRADSNLHGSFPEPQHSIRLRSGAIDSYLYSPNVPISPNKQYLVKSFLNVTSIDEDSRADKRPEVGYYIDEFDQNGNWVSGQWKKAERSVFVENMNFVYNPTSGQVKQARLQVYATAGGGVQAYVDNFQWLEL